MKIAAFDIETVKDFPEGEDWRAHRPLGVACIAISTGDSRESAYWTPDPSGGPDWIDDQMSQEDLRAVVYQLLRLQRMGYTLFSWNGLGFDFPVLADETGLISECRELARNHVDMMFHFFCEKGFPISLKAAAEGSGSAGKTEGMDGKEALRLWAAGERRKVVEYCQQDAKATLELAQLTASQKSISWVTRRGTVSGLDLGGKGWLAVREAMELPLPDTSWMDSHIPREQWTSWLVDQE